VVDVAVCHEEMMRALVKNLNLIVLHVTSIYDFKLQA